MAYDKGSDRNEQAEVVRDVPEENGHSELIDEAFTFFMSSGMDYLESHGLSEEDALEASFSVATLLAQEGVLPEFPEDPEDDQGKAEWLVAAYDLSFFELILESLAE